MSATYPMPEILENIPEVKFCFDFAEEMLNFFLFQTENAFKELDTDTATEKGIERKEKMFGITPSVTDTIEERRFRILVRERRIRVLNFFNLQKFVWDVAGERATTQRDEKRRELTVKVPLSSKKAYTTVKRFCEKYVPVTMNCTVTQMYNRWSDFSGKTYEELSGKTYEELREENGG